MAPGGEGVTVRENLALLHFTAKHTVRELLTLLEFGYKAECGCDSAKEPNSR